LLKWAGGKSRLAPLISSAFSGPCTGTYFEPFLGSAAVFLHRFAAGEVGAAVLSDANPKLTAFHIAVRDQVDDVVAKLAALPIEDVRDRYYDVREAFNDGPHAGPRHAARLIWLNRTNFNGLYRENRNGGYNVPAGRHQRIDIPSASRLREVSSALQGVEIVACSYEQAFQRAGRGDQLYCDPPYLPLNATARFTSYYRERFSVEHQVELAGHAMRAAFHGAEVVLSNHDVPLVRDELYRHCCGFRHVARPQVSRAIAGAAASRRSTAEIVAAIGPFPPTKGR
jgi:DNA adenine methylase